MGKLKYVIIFSFIAIVVGASAGLFLFSGGGGPGFSEPGKCKILKLDNEKGINIVFFAEREEDAERYMDYFLNFYPYNDNKEEFNFFYIQEPKIECEIYKDIALLCYSRALVKKSSICPNDHIIVLSNGYSASMRSSSYMNVLSINMKHPMSVLAHEFGHGFMNLAEEYVPAKIAKNSAGNCVDDCAKFEGRNDGCYEGCSEATYYRSIENGVMRTLSSEKYGSFNEYVIKKRIDELKNKGGISITGEAVSENNRELTITGAAVEGEDYADCNEQNGYFVEAEISGNTSGEVMVRLLKSPESMQGCAGRFDLPNGYFSVALIYEKYRAEIGKFGVYLFSTLPEALSGRKTITGETYLREGNIYLKIPKIDFEKYIDDLIRNESEGGIVANESYEEEKNFNETIGKEEEKEIIEENKILNESEELAPKVENVNLEIRDPFNRILVFEPVCAELLGDVNGDGIVDLEDYEIIQTYAQTGKSSSYICQMNIDVNKDNFIDGLDIEQAGEIFKNMAFRGIISDQNISAGFIINNSIFSSNKTLDMNMTNGTGRGIFEIVNNSGTEADVNASGERPLLSGNETGFNELNITGNGSRGPNHSPFFEFVPSQMYVCENDKFSIYFNVTDIDGDSLIIGLKKKSIFNVDPVFTNNTENTTQIRFFSEILDKSKIGTYNEIIYVSDGMRIDSKNVKIDVIEINNNPEIGFPGIKTIETGGQTKYFNYQVKVKDKESGDQNSGNFTFNLRFFKGKPFFEIDKFGRMNATIEGDAKGVYELGLCVSDKGIKSLHPNISLCGQDGKFFKICSNFSLTITNEEHSPIITSYFPENVFLNFSENKKLDFKITKEDIDGTIPDAFWYADNTLMAHDSGLAISNFSYEYLCGATKNHFIKVDITDGLLNDSLQWTLVAEKCEPGNAIVKFVDFIAYYNIINNFFIIIGIILSFLIIKMLWDVYQIRKRLIILEHYFSTIYK